MKRQITFICSECGHKIVRPNEYEAEIAFDRHCDEAHPYVPETPANDTPANDTPEED
jgi:hypothetical protein